MGRQDPRDDQRDGWPQRATQFLGDCGDLLRELLDGTRIDKWDYERGTAERLVSADRFDCASNNSTKANPCLCADILGDWREEVI